jgi:protein tyrosine phosphatase (PTP) superfamily phosphohydrolase (DUF442 family)
MTNVPQQILAEGLAGILNYRRISEWIGTAGQPTPEQFAKVRATGYEVVVNLAMPTSTGALPDEAGLVAAQGMDYVHIPVVWEAPTRDDLARFFEVMDRNRQRRVLVHCAMNMRVSAFVLLYRVIRQDVPLELASQDLLAIWRPEGVWADFMRRVLAEEGSITEGQGLPWTPPSPSSPASP